MVIKEKLRFVSVKHHVGFTTAVLSKGEVNIFYTSLSISRKKYKSWPRLTGTSHNDSITDWFCSKKLFYKKKRGYKDVNIGDVMTLKHLTLPLYTHVAPGRVVYILL